MHHINEKRRTPARNARGAVAALIAVLLACVGLTACGGSSNSSSTSATAAATSSTATNPPAGAASPGGGRFAALRECLAKNGITLPKRTPGQPPGGGGGFLGGGAGGGPPLPAGVTRAQYEAAVKKCGGAAFGGAGSRIKSPAYKQAVAKFAACMRENGVKLPEPNTSGNGPIFNTKGVNTASAQFKAAQTKCRGDLPTLGRRGTGGGPAG
jgi:hypothetical protein